MILLLAASVWSWGVIIDKLFNLGAASRIARGYEERAAAARDARDLVAASEAGAASIRCAACSPPGSTSARRALPGEVESAAERRDRIERAMRLALNGELRRLEQRLPFLATLGSAAPFIGLFGTVWGIMHSFASIAAANNTSLAVVAPGHRRGPVRDRDGARRGDPGGRRLQQVHGRDRPLRRAHAGADRPLRRAPVPGRLAMALVPAAVRRKRRRYL